MIAVIILHFITYNKQSQYKNRYESMTIADVFMVEITNVFPFALFIITAEKQTNLKGGRV